MKIRLFKNETKQHPKKPHLKIEMDENDVITGFTNHGMKEENFKKAVDKYKKDGFYTGVNLKEAISKGIARLLKDEKK